MPQMVTSGWQETSRTMFYRSTDDGATWTSVGITAPAGQTEVKGIAFAPNGDLWLVGRSPSDVYRSTDDGATWSSVGITAPADQFRVEGISVAPNGDLWLAGRSLNDVYRSEDDGATWTSVGITAPAGQTYVSGIAFDPRLEPAFADDTGDAISGTVGTAIANVTVPEAAGVPTPTYAASGLPAGLSFNTTTRVLSGTPTAAGSGTITVTATNSAGEADWTVAYTFAPDVTTENDDIWRLGDRDTAPATPTGGTSTEGRYAGGVDPHGAQPDRHAGRLAVPTGRDLHGRRVHQRDRMARAYAHREGSVRPVRVRHAGRHRHACARADRDRDAGRQRGIRHRRQPGRAGRRRQRPGECRRRRQHHGRPLPGDFRRGANCPEPARGVGQL